MDDNTIRALIQAELAKNGGANGQTPYQKAGQPGMMGMGEIMTNPEQNKAAQDLATTVDDGTALGLMADPGTNVAARGGGRMSGFEAAANGLKTGLGTYMMLNNMSSKKNAIASMLRKKKPAIDTGITDQDFSAGDSMTTPLEG